MYATFARDLDPLDLEVVERAIEGLPAAIKPGRNPAELNSDDELERALRRQLAEMVRRNGVSDPYLLLDMLVEGMTKRDRTGPTMA